jgi:ABC-type Fe3+-hydroxamate transport system substrate-binding protein
VALLRVRDDLGRELTFMHPPMRLVSLVPSDTFTLFALGAGDRLVARTRFCDAPEAASGLPVIGGTKDVDVDAVLALEPHLVIANQEENSRAALESLAQRVPVYVSLPRTVDAGLAHVARLARVLGLAKHPPAAALMTRGYQALRQRSVQPLRRAFVPIWMQPLMTLNGDTYGSDALRFLGFDNAFADRPRLYPLAADLGKSIPDDPAGRDTRYPRITLGELATRAPEVIVLPDEPYAFSQAEADQLQAAVPGAEMIRVSGRDLFWYGAWAVESLTRGAR